MNRTARVLVAGILVLLGATASLFFGGRIGQCLVPLGWSAVECALASGSAPDVGLALMISLATFVLAPVPSGRRLRVLVAGVLGGAIGAATFLALRPLATEGFDSSGTWVSIPRPLDPYALATAIILAALVGTIPLRLLPEGQRPRLRLIALGILVAIGAPAAQILVAWLWDRGVISPEPNGLFVQTLQFGSGVELLLAPLGICFIGVGYRLATPVRWIVLFALCSPVIAVLWFLGAASLGGLAGEPF